MIDTPFTRRAVAIAGIALAVPALAVALKTDPAKSSIAVTFKQMNVPVDAKFKTFSAQIDYDAAHPETAKAKVDIDVASFDLGDPQYNKEITKKEWFNTAQFPKASFESSSMKKAANGSLSVSGKLTIKGKSANVSFPLQVKAEGTNQVFDGALPIKRLAFNIGEGEWKDTDTVADEVVIKFHVVTTQ